MAKNTLFNFISRADNTIQLPSEYQLALDSNREHRDYYRIECPKINNFILKSKEDEYMLDNHHVSIYENENRENPNLSQYHYTAEFINLQGERFRLHVYFNSFDVMLPNISFEKKSLVGYQKVEKTELEDQLIVLALQHTKPLMQSLRQQHNERIKTLEAQYHVCEEQLSEFFGSKENHVAEELMLAERACSILGELTPLVRSPNYQKLLRFHQISARALHEYQLLEVSSPNPSEAEHRKSEVDRSFDAAINESDSIHSQEIEVIEEIAKAPTLQEPSTPPKEKMVENIAQTQADTSSTNPKAPRQNKLYRELQLLNLQLEKISKESEKVQAKELESLLAKTYEISLTFERQMKPKDLQQLQRIRQGIHKVGASLLTSLLFHNQFDLAASLTSFHHLLRAEKYLNVALQTRNSGLLDFILQYGDIDVNHQEVTVRKKQYQSMVHACFYEDRPNQSTNECLSILIKHGASLLIPNDKGLPLAYSILAAEAHPLCKALFMNRDKTVESIDFIKNLLRLLKASSHREDLNAEEAQTIHKEIDSLTVQLNGLQNAQLENPGSRYLMKQMHHLEEKFQGSFISKLKKDPEIVALNRELQKEVGLLNQKTTKAQQRRGRMIVANNMEHLNKILDNIDLSDLDFDSLKKSTLENLRSTLQLVHKKSRLIDVQQEITRFPLHSARGNKRYRDNLKEQEELIKEIKELEAKNSMFMDYKAMGETLHDLELINKTMESFKDMGSLLTQFSSLFSSIKETTDTSSPSNSKSEEEEDEDIDLNVLGKELKDLLSTFGKKL
ncbi:coiled-coil-containing protein [Legionella wadsworthii]|uniref:Coiled-coil-containing protein n=1 Tax=Legionella wadsworthii TaxID=28088 RepID=A0A378LW08_9GAMM|nr:hypothetical protein [Legionella wadsworthii]STY31111.1 coiled-coil-containing protein [Legionella wadsworthii]